MVCEHVKVAAQEVMTKPLSSINNSKMLLWIVLYCLSACVNDLLVYAITLPLCSRTAATPTELAVYSEKIISVGAKLRKGLNWCHGQLGLQVDKGIFTVLCSS